MTWSQYNAGVWKDGRGLNRLDGGAPFYDAYECADGAYVALGSIESQFYKLLREKAGLSDPAFDDQMNKANWPALKEKVVAAIRTKTRAEWCVLMEGTDVCFAPVLTLEETPAHPHDAARQTLSMSAALPSRPRPRAIPRRHPRRRAPRQMLDRIRTRFCWGSAILARSSPACARRACLAPKKR